MKSLPSNKNKSTKDVKEEVQQFQRYSYDTDLHALAKRMTQLDDPEFVEKMDEGDAHLQEAVRKAKEILSIARNGADQIREEARQKGYDEGHILGMEAGRKEGYNEYLNQIAQEKKRLEQDFELTVAEIDIIKRELLDEYLEDLKNIAMTVAEKVIRVSLQTSGDIIKKMILSATEKLSKSQWAKIYISKIDADVTMEGDSKFLAALSNVSDNVKVIPMDTEEQGLCIIELPKEVIDVSVNTQIDNIKNIINTT